ncbi:glycosyltransferase family 4 protein [Phycicoccus duodecadis]|uniref:Glycosyltransferase involved in cell wall biosynthesis n=1 Tax=Phycicoccus duodecadis TaxID=173053 RepID=A0A2N3YJQ6_9MICO|nr:glycosyltransferase family 4 protein [Phycicoccus duodecadis]PKW27086.1 glycosyltransferase involved in cell wall biosynthesis [Phycicoccus duodecadis]
MALWVVPVSDLAGVARHVLDVAAVGVPGHRLVVLCPPGPLAERLRDAGAAVSTAPVGPGDGVRESVAAVRHAVGALRPAVVHSHLSWADVVTAAATVGSRAALVSTEHGIADDDLVYHGTAWRSRLKEALHTARLRRADAVVAVSAATARSVRAKWHPGPRTIVRVVPNGVDRVERPARPPGLHVVSVARLAPEKRVEAAVRAFAVLHERRPEARLTVAGTGDGEAALRSLVAERGLGDVVDLVGHVDAPGLLARADVLVQLSVWENCSYSLLDALAHGCGAVATDVGGNGEILPASALVAHDDPAAVADEIERQGLDPATRPRLAAAWPTRQEMCERLAAVYAEVGA